MRLLALDQSSRITGWAIYEDNKLIQHGKIEEDSDNLATRLVGLRNKIIKLLSDYNIDEVAMEDIQEQNNIQTFKALAEVYGVLEELFKEKKVPYRTVYASSWKSTCGIRGRARAEQKRNAQEYVITTYGIKATQDECDAICIGHHCINEKNSAF